MKSRASDKFWLLYHRLPPEIQCLADRNYALWRENHCYPSLHFKKVKFFWVARVGGNYRSVGIEFQGTITWFWIGPHDEYEQLIKG